MPVKWLFFCFFGFWFLWHIAITSCVCVEYCWLCWPEPNDLTAPETKSAEWKANSLWMTVFRLSLFASSWSSAAASTTPTNWWTVSWQRLPGTTPADVKVASVDEVIERNYSTLLISSAGRWINVNQDLLQWGSAEPVVPLIEDCCVSRHVFLPFFPWPCLPLDLPHRRSIALHRYSSSHWLIKAINLCTRATHAGANGPWIWRHYANASLAPSKRECGWLSEGEKPVIFSPF